MCEVVRKCPLLLELDLNDVPVSNATVYNLFLHSSHLRDISLKNNQLITDEAFPNLLELMEMSEDEAARAARSAPDYALEPEPDSNSSHSGASPLRTLRRPVTETMEPMRQIDLTGCNQLTDNAISNLVANAPKTRNLTLAKCSELTDAAIDSLGRLGKNLHHIHLGHVNQCVHRQCRD